MPTDAAELKEFLQEAAVKGKAEELIWDREMLEVKRDGEGQSERSERRKTSGGGGSISAGGPLTKDILIKVYYV